MKAEGESGKLTAQGSEETGWVYMSEHAEMASSPTNPPVARSAAAERMRARRQRRRDGLRCIVVQLRETEVDELIRRKLLQADARNDVYAVRDALHAHFVRQSDA